MRATLGGLVAAGIALAGLGGCIPVEGEHTKALASESARLVGEAEAFMAAYAEEIRRGDRAAIAARYFRTGAILIRGGRRQFATHADIVARYNRPAWSPPATFEWRDLHFEAVGSDAVVVIGKFAWGERQGPPGIGTYNALLRREDGELRIRIEDEAADQGVAG